MVGFGRIWSEERVYGAFWPGTDKDGRANEPGWKPALQDTAVAPDRELSHLAALRQTLARWRFKRP